MGGFGRSQERLGEFERLQKTPGDFRDFGRLQRLLQILEVFRRLQETSGDDDVSTLSFSELCIQDVSIKCLLESEPEGVQPSINLTAATMEMPSTMEILCSNDVWVCNTTASNHFSNGMAS